MGGAALALVWTVACATSNSRSAFSEAEWRHQVRLRHLPVAETVYPFEASPEMDEFAAQVAERFRAQPPVVKLIRLQKMLFDKKVFEFAYDDASTLTAAEAFAQRRGNCLAFTSLFIALSRAMGIQTVLVLPEVW